MVHDDFFLPEGIIQHIQSFLTAKEAARTSVVSKSWHAAWLTRPDLDFDQWDFNRRDLGGDADDIFWQFVEKTARRYEESNRRIQRLRLYVMRGQDNVSRAEKLIVRALKLGATDIQFKGVWFDIMVLPEEVLGSETLRRLSVRRGKIGLGNVRKARCSRLESLSLENVVCTDGDVIRDIISSCPSIDNLSLSVCEFERTDKELWRLRPFGKLSGSGVNGVISLFNKLRRLFVEKVPIDNSFFHDFASKFPCLKDFSVHNCDGYRGLIQIASSSLESISFVQKIMMRAKFDVPCIRKFTYQGTSVPSLSFKNHSRGWKSDVSVSITINRHCVARFPRLKKLLASLSQDEICLSLKISKFTDKSSDNGRDEGLAPVAVKDLVLYLEVPSSISSSFLKGLFRSCRPELITLHLFTGEKRRNHDFLVLLCKTIAHLELSAVNFEIFHEGLAEWLPTQLERLLEASLSPEWEVKIRFQLR